jgi:hypothetical protein
MTVTLEQVSILAQEYYEAEAAGHREETRAIDVVAAGFDAVRMALFCQQLVSWCRNTNQASTYLTILTNRINQLGK